VHDLGCSCCDLSVALASRAQPSTTPPSRQLNPPPLICSHVHNNVPNNNSQVRYENRKTCAHQRTRIKGRFAKTDAGAAGSGAPEPAVTEEADHDMTDAEREAEGQGSDHEIEMLEAAVAAAARREAGARLMQQQQQQAMGAALAMPPVSMPLMVGVSHPLVPTAPPAHLNLAAAVAAAAAAAAAASSARKRHRANSPSLERSHSSGSNPSPRFAGQADAMAAELTAAEGDDVSQPGDHTLAGGDAGGFLQQQQQ